MKIKDLKWQHILLILVLTVVSSLSFNAVSVSSVDLLYHPQLIKDGTVLSLYEAKKIWQAGEAVFVDARNVMQYDRSHIPGSVNVVYSTQDVSSEAGLKSLDKNTNLVVYCYSATCNQANILAKKLNEAGYDRVAIFAGGYSEWRKAGYPLESAKR